MLITKQHLTQLPIIEIPFDQYPRDSQDVALSIPIFGTKKGWVGPFNQKQEFDINLFRHVVVKAAVWAAYSLMANTDLCENGMPIYFHIEDQIYDQAMSVMHQFNVPEQWIRKTTFPEPDIEQFHPRHGKKLYCYTDPDINANVIGMWDADSLVYRPPGTPKYKWYHYFQNQLKDTMLTSFYSEWNGGDASYVQWLRIASGLTQIPDNATSPDDLKKFEFECYEKLGLPKPKKQFRYGSAVLFLPKAHPMVEYIAQHYHNAYTDEGFISLWMNAIGCPFLELEKLWMPILKNDDDFMAHTEGCIAHPFGQKENLPKLMPRLIRGIDGLHLTQDKKPEWQLAPNGHRIRAHFLSVPHNPSHKDYSCCAFGQKARKGPWMLDYYGHEVYHYGNELSDVRCTEHITVTTEADLTEAYDDFRTQSEFYTFAEDDYVYQMYNMRVNHELRKRIQPGDFICYTFAPYQKKLHAMLQDIEGVHHVESGIGYYYPYMQYKVFESPSLMHFNYGIFQRNYDTVAQLTEAEKEERDINWHDHVHHGWMQWQDAVIPNSFDLEDFEFRVDKEDYLLYLGRILPGKGIEEAMRIADATGRKLIVAGQGDFEKEMGFKPWDCVELFGRADVQQRKELLSKASALMCLSRYPEPFGGVFVEAMLSGTVPIATQIGAFGDYIQHGYNGYLLRLNVLEQGIWAVNNVNKIDPYNVRETGLRFTNQVIGRMYDEYFSSLVDLTANGGKPYWILNPERTQLNWIDYTTDIDWSIHNLDKQKLMTPIS